MKKVLFSPIGNTDPIRECYDGACLHIVRHYQPDEVVLFFTKEMWEREQANHCYTRAIAHVAPDCPVRCIASDIVDAHLYDSFIEVLPGYIRELQEDDTEILLNLSSGTPQIKTMMAIVAVEDGLRGIQVVSPNKASNSRSVPVQAGDDVEAMLANNFDDEPGAENRCQEPPLQVIRYFSERQRIMSLIKLYEYEAAYELARGSASIAKEAKELLHHAALRRKLMTQEARKVCNGVDGFRLFLNVEEIKNRQLQEKAEHLTEYLVNLVVFQRKGYLSEFLVKCNNFLFELLEYYVRTNCRKLNLRQCMKGRIVSRDLLLEKYPALLAELDACWRGGFRDSELSFGLLCRVIEYAHANAYYDDKNKAEQVAVLLGDVFENGQFSRMRNSSAHTISDVTEALFREMVGASSGEFMQRIVKIAGIVIHKHVIKLSGVYDIINRAITDTLTVRA